MSDPMEILAKGTQDYPALPDNLPENSRRAASGGTMLADRCYFIAYGPPGSSPLFEGTLRVESRSGQLSASGDLYETLDAASDMIGQVPPLCSGIPIFPIANYGYYLRVTQIEATGDSITLAFEAIRHTREIFLTLEGSSSSSWQPQGSFTAQMNRAPAPPGYPNPELFFLGTVAREDGTQVGEIQIGWVSALLRKATIEMDRMPESEVPLNNEAGLDWQTVFSGFGWEVTALPSDSDIKKDGDPVWNGEDARTTMEARRDSADLDSEWRYHLLSGRMIDFQGGVQRGAMYDLSTRQGLFVSSHLEFDATEERWGPLRGVRAGSSMLTFFRTAVHEMGHAMGLGHNGTGVAFMRPTDGIADRGTPDTPFPTNIHWGFAPEDEHRLRHWPDLIVRPGGTGFRTGPSAPLAGG